MATGTMDIITLSVRHTASRTQPLQDLAFRLGSPVHRLPLVKPRLLPATLCRQAQ